MLLPETWREGMLGMGSQKGKIRVLLEAKKIFFVRKTKILPSK